MPNRVNRLRFVWSTWVLPKTKASVVVAVSLLTFASLVPAQNTFAAAQETQSAVVECDVSASGILLLQFESNVESGSNNIIAIEAAGGAEIGRIPVPALDAIYSTGLPDRALAIAGNRLFLIDAAKLVATEIDIPGGATELAPNPVQFRGSTGERYLLLGSPSFDRALLIDVELGLASSLSDLLRTAPDAPVFVPFAAIAPGDRHVIMWDGRHVFVVETALPTKARQVDDGEFAFAPDVSPDGQDLVYSQSDSPGSGSTMMLQPIEGGAPFVLLESTRALVTLWIPKSRTVLIDARNEQGAAGGDVSLFDVDTKIERPLLNYAGSLTLVQLSPDGGSALLGVERIEGGEWYAANLADATVDLLPQLSGGRALPGLYADAPWALIVPVSQEGGILSGPAYRGVELSTGGISRLLEIDLTSEYLALPLLSPDGRFSLVFEERSGHTVLWLLDSQDLRSVEFGIARHIDASFSPDGCFVVVTTEEGLTTTTAVYLSSEPDAPALFTIDDASLLVWIAA